MAQKARNESAIMMRMIANEKLNRQVNQTFSRTALYLIWMCCRRRRAGLRAKTNREKVRKMNNMRKQQTNAQMTCIFLIGSLVKISNYRALLVGCILNLQRYMFKNSDKRFEYDISPQLSDDAQLFPSYHHQNYGHPYPVSTTTPVNRRSSFNQATFDTRERHQISTQEPVHMYEGMEERMANRSRGNSTTGFKRSVEKAGPRNDKSHISQDNFKQTKKVYFGATEPLHKEVQQQNNRSAQNSRYESNNRGYRNDQNRRNNGQELNSFNWHDNNPHQHQRTQSKDPKPRKSQKPRTDFMPDLSLNEQELMDKIGRINRLNQQINARLQRMLSKIDNP